jgi:hypothetical protein
MILDTTLGATPPVEKPIRRRSAVADDHAAWRFRRATDRERSLGWPVARRAGGRCSDAAESGEGDR